MKRDEFYLNELMLILAVIIAGLSGFWYYNAVFESKALADAKIGELQNSCNVNLPKSDCVITQNTYDFENAVLCSSTLKQSENSLNQKIQASYNLIQIKELMRSTAVKDTAEISGTQTIGEFAAANDYFKKTSELKLQVLQNTGAVESCIYRNAKMSEYADCDLKKAQLFVNPKSEVATFYFRSARSALGAQEYLKAIYYTTAAVSYSGETARQGYADIVEASRTQGLVC